MYKLEVKIRQKKKKIEIKAADIQEARSIWYTNCGKLQICHHKKKKKIVEEACGEFYFQRNIYLFHEFSHQQIQKLKELAIEKIGKSKSGFN